MQLFIPFHFCFFMCVCMASTQDTITVTRPLREGETLVSSHGKFELGFFRPGSDNRRYVGIWYNNIPTQTIVWVANREKPLVDSSGGVLRISKNSALVLSNGTEGIIWSTNTSRSVQNPIAQLLDNGNLVVRDKNNPSYENYLWQSFDYPTDTQLPGMKIGRDFVSGFDRYLTSWKSSDDPSPGSYTYRIDPSGYPQPILYKDSVEISRDGPWNGFWFSGYSILDPNPNEEYNFVLNKKEVYYLYNLINTSIIALDRIVSMGILQRVVWDSKKLAWGQFLSKPIDNCDSYEICGAFGICNLVNTPMCECMKGYVPKSPQKDSGQWSDGCVRVPPLNCTTDNGFVKYSNVKLPDTRNSWFNTTLTLAQCKNKCLQNCSCVAYANLNTSLEPSRGTGCLLWFDTLIDVRVISGRGQDLYVRAASSGSGYGGQMKRNLTLELRIINYVGIGDQIPSFQRSFHNYKETGPDNHRFEGKRQIWIPICSSLLGVLLLSGVIIFVLRRKRRSKMKDNRGCEGESRSNNSKRQESELPIFPFNVIADSTNFFSLANKIGEGGFGPVYKGVLSDGQQIAVKRLSKDSKQGVDEFKNEALFIAKLQHRNLVKLIGCCIEKDEQMLIYEYMPNKSLDYFIFGNCGTLLDWCQRFDIIKGIARGILYLHQDSRLRIVHRDLKASNILLDTEMNAKISDFGMARSFDGGQDEAQTRRVVGTYGYMPPEYTIDGLFSVKSDVFSFGVLVLEIVCGTKNRGFEHPEHHHNLVGHAWMLFKEDATLDIVDPLIWNPSYALEMQRSIHIGLLCVQQNPVDRPSMQVVTVMLSSDSELPEPKQPGFFTARNVQQDSTSAKTEHSSTDEMTMTLLTGR